MNSAIEISGLHYQFAKAQPLLQGLCLQVPQAGIYGFLGPNGAGKTTTLKLILGLLSMQQGRIHLFGKSLRQQRRQILPLVGSLIETPSIYGHLSATDNLRIWQLLYQVPKSRISAVLAQTGLQHTGTKRAGKFSLGMRQRLGIAIALLQEPRLLILDEPTNGLDPEGILEIRELLFDLNRQQGMTILVSSHLLAEIDRLASHIGLLHAGRLRFEGSIDTLRKEQARQAVTRIRTSDPQKAAIICQAAGLSLSRQSDSLLVETQEPSSIAKLNRLLIEQGLDVFEISTQQTDLEALFMNLIKKDAC